MLPINLGEIPLHFPESQEDIDEQLFADLSSYLFLPESIQNRTKMAIAIINNQLGKKAKKVWDNCYVDANGWSVLADRLTWINDLKEVSTDKPVKAWISTFQHKGETYHLPETNFNDVSVDEFNHINMYLDRIQGAESNIEGFVLSLVATVARPLRPEEERKSNDWDGYPRIYFNAEAIADRRKKLEDIAPYILIAVLDFCRRCQELIHLRNEKLFEGGKDDGTNLGWYGMILSIAETGVFGPEKEVKHIPIHRACLFALKKKLEAEQLRRELKSNEP